jgi:uncharacterized protein YpmS
MPDAVFGIVAILILMVAVTAWMMLYVRMQQSRARANAEYHEMVERMTSAQQQLHDEVAEVAARVAAIQRLLQDVE